jgi:hypothetical protein
MSDQFQIVPDLGRAIKPDDLAKRLDIDVRTVKKYPHLWGGLRTTPRGGFRFFENLVEEAIYANIDNEKRKKTLERRCNNGWGTPGKTIPGQQQEKQAGLYIVGKRNQRGNPEKPKDKYGIFNR